MASITKTFNHSLGKEEAARRIRERVSSEKITRAMVATVTREVWTNPYNLEFSMIVFNYRLDGDLCIDDALVTLNLNLPMGATAFKGMIDDQISKQMELMIK